MTSHVREDLLPQPGSVIASQYRIDSLLGMGGMGSRRRGKFPTRGRGTSRRSSPRRRGGGGGGGFKTGGGFGWHERDLPPTSDEFVEAQAPFYLHMIECFDPDRCMFESNFPVDRLSISYPVLWNGLKKIVRDFSEDEKDAMFRGTATRVYRL